MIHTHTDADGIRTLIWDMPGRAQNVFGVESLEALAAAVERAVEDGVAGLIVSSGKKDFCAGGDLELLSRAEVSSESAGALSRVLRRLETCGIPVAAAIRGVALGGGFELALACHRRFAHPGARVGLPEVTVGLLPGGGGTQRLPRLIGIRAALPLLMEGKQVAAADLAEPADDPVEAARTWLLTRPEPVQPWDRKGFRSPLDDELDTLMIANAMYTARTYGRYPAGRAILSCVFEGLRTTLDEGLKIETRWFVSLLRDPVSKAMIRTLFLSPRQDRRPPGVPVRTYVRVGVLGAGLMGSGIAYTAARAGLHAVVLDVSEERAYAAHTYASRRPELAERIHPTTDYADLADCDAVIEAVFEDRDVKAAVTRAADAVLGDALIASNTSTLPITGLAEASSRPERFVGLHFFSPVERMQLVEVIRGRQTSDATLAHALDLVRALGKTPIVVNDRRGFYTSRVFGTYVTEGMAALRDGVLPALVENAGRMSGMPMPPLKLSDQVGLRLMHQVGEQTRRDLGDAAPHNPAAPVLARMVELGRGFYDEGRLWSGLRELFPPAPAQPDADELVERFLYVQALEAARCMDEGVLLAATDADVGAVLGWGFAPWTGGPLSYIDRVGAAAFVARADALAAVHGPRFEAPVLLRRMAAEHRAFYPG